MNCEIFGLKNIEATPNKSYYFEVNCEIFGLELTVWENWSTPISESILGEIRKKAGIGLDIGLGSISRSKNCKIVWTWSNIGLRLFPIKFSQKKCWSGHKNLFVGRLCPIFPSHVKFFWSKTNFKIVREGFILWVSDNPVVPGCRISLESWEFALFKYPIKWGLIFPPLGVIYKRKSWRHFFL